MAHWKCNDGQQKPGLVQQQAGGEEHMTSNESRTKQEWESQTSKQEGNT